MTLIRQVYRCWNCENDFSKVVEFPIAFQAQRGRCPRCGNISGIPTHEYRTLTDVEVREFFKALEELLKVTRDQIR